jgi:hypothetical protein
MFSKYCLELDHNYDKEVGSKADFTTHLKPITVLLHKKNRHFGGCAKNRFKTAVEHNYSLKLLLIV